MTDWIADTAAVIARHAERELDALVGVSSPSGDVNGAEEAVRVATAFLPDEAEFERIPCSSEGYAPDLLAQLHGTGAKRLLLIGHLDTVHAHEAHRPAERNGDKLVGSGAVDMKGGDVLALGVLRALVPLTEHYGQVALLFVNDEEWRVGDLKHAPSFEGWDACLCFEAGQTGPTGDDEVVVKRKAAATLRVESRGQSSHSGSAPDKGRNALLALAAAAQAVAACHDPAGPERLSAVPTIARSGEAFNVVPDAGELYCDVRADRLDAFAPVLEAVPLEVGGATLHAELVRQWPGMDAREATAPLLEAAAGRLGRPLHGGERGGASDASHVSQYVPLTIDGLGPRGGGAHTPQEFVALSTLRSRAEVALAIVAALLELPRG
jgi:glutamate carboxypeptidase